MKGLGNEVAKNLVLAGINSMTILDHEILTKEDNFSIFLAPPEQVGKNRAQASLERLKQRNPMVEITADETNLDNKEKDFFRWIFDYFILQEENTQSFSRMQKMICSKVKKRDENEDRNIEKSDYSLNTKKN